MNSAPIHSEEKQNLPGKLALDLTEQKILRAVRELSYGVVEVVVHDRRVTEIKQTRRTRISGSPTE